jgi:hypothetical protein
LEDDEEEEEEEEAESEYNEEIIVDSPPTPPRQPAPQNLPTTPVAPTTRPTAAPTTTEPISTPNAPLQLNSFPNYTGLGYPTSGTAAFLFPSGEIVISPNPQQQQPAATAALEAARQWTNRQQNESAGLYYCPYRASPYTFNTPSYHHPYSRSSQFPAPMLYDHPLSAPAATSGPFQARHPCPTQNSHLWEYSQMPQVLPPPLMGMLSPHMYSNQNSHNETQRAAASCPATMTTDQVHTIPIPAPQTTPTAKHASRRR